MDMMSSGLKTILSTSADVLPIVLFIIFFQLFVIRQPVRDARRLVAGLVFTILGLGLFLVGLEQALFPLGRLMAQQLTHPEFLMPGGETLDFHWSHYFWVYVFALAIGFATTIAEPAHVPHRLPDHEHLEQYDKQDDRQHVGRRGQQRLEYGTNQIHAMILP